MSGSQQVIKTRIRGIKTTRKITNAMELIAIGKLKRQRERFDANKYYSMSLKDIVTEILNYTNEIENVFLQERIDDNPLTIVYLSDLGLCGGYNSNVTRLIIEQLPKTGKLLVIGSRGKYGLREYGYQVNREDIASDTMDYNEFSEIADEILNDYKLKKISSINIVYTKYRNSMSFAPQFEKLLPISKKESADLEYKEILYEPDIDTILFELVPLYIKSLFYGYWLESTTSEHSARRLAMDMATDNADDLVEELTLEYNQARQASITQEINEIVMAADAI